MSVLSFPQQAPAVETRMAVAAIAIWQTRLFDTLEIAGMTGLPESAVVRIIDIARKAAE